MASHLEEFWSGYLERKRKVAGGTRTNFIRWGRDNQGWLSNRNNTLFRNVPDHLKPRAHAELARLIAKAKAEGKAITCQKYGSLVGNAAFIAKHIHTGTGKRSPHLCWLQRFYTFRSLRRKAMNPQPKPGSLIKGARVHTNPVD
jgi:hypothetical protein